MELGDVINVPLYKRLKPVFEPYVKEIAVEHFSDTRYVESRINKQIGKIALIAIIIFLSYNYK